MTATETALIGDWIWIKTEYYTGGSLTSTTDPTTSAGAYAGAHMNLKSSWFLGIADNPQNYDGDFYYSSTYGQSSLWSVLPIPNGDLMFQTPNSNITCAYGYIETLNSTTLTIQAYTIGGIPNGSKWYYYK
jgi:hypothetical protein